MIKNNINKIFLGVLCFAIAFFCYSLMHVKALDVHETYFSCSGRTFFGDCGTYTDGTFFTSFPSSTNIPVSSTVGTLNLSTSYQGYNEELYVILAFRGSTSFPTDYFKLSSSTYTKAVSNTFKVPYNTDFQCFGTNYCSWTSHYYYVVTRLSSSDYFQNLSYRIQNTYYDYNGDPLLFLFTKIYLLNSSEYLTFMKEVDNQVLQQQQQDNQKETNKKLDDLNKTQKETNNLIKDTTPPNIDNIINGVGWLKSGPLDSILNLPLVLLNNITDNLAGTCVPLDVTLPYIDTNMQLPCVKDVYAKFNATQLLNTIGTIFSCIFLYRYLINQYKWIDKLLSMQNANSDWGGV